MKQVIILEVAGSKCINDCQCRLGTVHHCDRHGTVQRHDWRRLQTFELIVEPEDTRPVRVFEARCPTMQGGDCRLQCKRTRSATKRLLDQRQRFGDQLPIPAATVLLFENNDIACLIERASRRAL